MSRPAAHVIRHHDPTEFAKQVNEARGRREVEVHFSTHMTTVMAGSVGVPRTVYVALLLWWEPE